MTSSRGRGDKGGCKRILACAGMTRIHKTLDLVIRLNGRGDRGNGRYGPAIEARRGGNGNGEEIPVILSLRSRMTAGMTRMDAGRTRKD